MGASCVSPPARLEVASPASQLPLPELRFIAAILIERHGVHAADMVRKRAASFRWQGEEAEYHDWAALLREIERMLAGPKRPTDTAIIK